MRIIPVKVTTEELERCEVLMTVEVEPNQEQDLLKKAAQRIARQIRIPGFRPGKAPYNVVVRRFGLEAIQQEALEHSADKVIQEALEEAKVQPFAQIQLDSINWDPLTIKIKVPTQPKVELNQYRDIRLDSEAIEVTEEDINQSLERLREQSATWAPVDRPAQLGDLVTMAVIEKAGDEILAEQESVEYELTAAEEEQEEEEQPEQEEGEDQPEDQEQEEAPQPFQPDLTTPLLGLSAGEEKNFTITYPEDFNEERYAGKEITFEVKVSSVKAKELDPLDDEFAKSVSDFDTLDELKEDIENNIREQRQRQQDLELGNKALEQIVQEATIVWPLAFEEESVEQEMSNFERRVTAYGLTLDRYLQMENKTQEEFQAETRERVVNNLERTLTLGKIAELENLQVSESEILQRAKLISDYSGYGEQLWRSILGSPAQQNAIAADLLIEKVTQWLGMIARGEEPKVDSATDESEEAEQGEVTAKVAPPGSATESSLTIEEEIEAVSSTDEAEDNSAESDASATETEESGDESTEAEIQAEVKS
jgi:trigger factor